jgi:polyhydroxyalkanoate synthesis regulator phasin
MTPSPTSLKELHLSDVMGKALLCGLGLASLTKDAIQKTAEDLVKQSKISEEEGRKLVKDLQGRSKRAQKALEKEVDSAVHKLFQNLDLAAIINDRLKDAKPPAKAAKKTRRRGGAVKTRSR